MTKETGLDNMTEMQLGAQKLLTTLESFKINAEVTNICRGPSVTRYELVPEAGVRINKITNLSDDIALRLAATSVRIEAPIPGKSAIGIEVPNSAKSMVSMREIIDTPQFRDAKSKLTVALGKDITGNIICADLAKMPHLLVAGTTGSGKSVCLNSMIVSILYNASPDEVKLLMIDPKMVEFTVYNGIAHLEVPVVSNPRKAAGALGWAVGEMEKRYKQFSENSVRDIKGFNKLCETRDDLVKMHQIVIFIDELSDLMMVSPKEVEDCIQRLAQMARAAGIHLVIATQRPSVDVIRRRLTQEQFLTLSELRNFSVTVICSLILSVHQSLPVFRVALFRTPKLKMLLIILNLSFRPHTTKKQCMKLKQRLQRLKMQRKSLRMIPTKMIMILCSMKQ